MLKVSETNKENGGGEVQSILRTRMHKGRDMSPGT